ncbi:hypothetical protein BDZ89DRAFT_1134117 [Hymenopellis radicata]|nr:hypothetical protein BDZ89DRAFT_1134117 [Hymenopellis radicata]
MHTPAFITHIKVSAMERRSSSGAAAVASKAAFMDVAKSQSTSRPRSNSLPTLTQYFKGTLSLSRRHSPNSSSSSLLSRPATRASTFNPQIKSRTRSFSESFPRMSRMNLRSLFTGRRRSDKLRRNTVGSLNEIETDDLSSSSSSPPRRKDHDMFSPDVSITNDTIGFYDEANIPSRYPVTGHMREEEPLSPDTPLPALVFDDDEDISELEEDDMLLMQERRYAADAGVGFGKDRFPDVMRGGGEKNV